MNKQQDGFKKVIRAIRTGKNQQDDLINTLKAIVNHGMPMDGATQATWRRAFMSVDSIARKALQKYGESE